MGALVPEQRKEPRYKVAYHTYIASGKWLSYTLSVEHIVGWKYAKCSMLVRQIFTTCWLRHAHVRKDTRLSPLFRTASDRKLGGAWERGYVSSLISLSKDLWMGCSKWQFLGYAQTAEKSNHLLTADIEVCGLEGTPFSGGSRILKRGFRYVIKVPARGVWGHAPQKNVGFLTFWDCFWCIVGVL